MFFVFVRSVGLYQFQTAQTLFIESIVEAADFKFHNTKYEPGKSVGNLSREIIKSIDTRDSNVKDYVDFLSNFIYNISFFSGFKGSDKEIMFKKFYRFSVGDESLCNGSNSLNFCMLVIIWKEL